MKIFCLIWRGSEWIEFGTDLDVSTLALDTLGINGEADTINRFAVNSDASLFNHDGSGHQLKINKAATNGTASLLLQNNFSGRAEIGLVGD